MIILGPRAAMVAIGGMLRNASVPSSRSSSTASSRLSCATGSERTSWEGGAGRPASLANETVLLRRRSEANHAKEETFLVPCQVARVSSSSFFKAAAHSRFHQSGSAVEERRRWLLLLASSTASWGWLRTLGAKSAMVAMGGMLRLLAVAVVASSWRLDFFGLDGGDDSTRIVSSVSSSKSPLPLVVVEEAGDKGTT